MNSVVLIRFIYFYLSFCFHIALAAAAGVAIRSEVPVTGAPAALFLAILGALTLFGLLGFDLNRTRSGAGFFSFISKIWFELSMMVLFTILHFATFIIMYDQNKDTIPCTLGNSVDSRLKSCSALQLIWAFQLTVGTTGFLYATYLGTISVMAAVETPKVFSAAVRDFPWGVHKVNGPRRNVPDPNAPIHFPVSTLPTFDQAFPQNSKQLEEGREAYYYPSLPEVGYLHRA